LLYGDGNLTLALATIDGLSDVRLLLAGKGLAGWRWATGNIQYRDNLVDLSGAEGLFVFSLSSCFISGSGKGRRTASTTQKE
jgi:hypothetical protein